MLQCALLLSFSFQHLRAQPRGKRLFSDRGISGRAHKRQRVAGNILSETKTASEVEAGGFLLDDAEEAGGFLVEDTTSSEPGKTGNETLRPDPAYIRLADIPTAVSTMICTNQYDLSLPSC